LGTALLLTALNVGMRLQATVLAPASMQTLLSQGMLIAMS
jgi:hypothetical protein